MPPSKISRELSIAYGGYTVGGDQEFRKLDSVYIHEEDFERAVVEYVFTIHATSEADFASEISTAEQALRTPRQDLTITQGSSTIKSYSHGSGTGFNANPTIRKTGDDLDSGRARRYTARIEFGLPADTTGTSGRRDSTVNVTYTPARRKIVTISGTYTIIGGVAARTQYNAQIGAYATSVLNAIGGTYKIAEEPTTEADDQNKVIRFTIVYEEIIMTGVGNSDADVRREVLTINRQQVGPGDTPNAGATINRLVTLNARYEAWIDRDNSTDLTGKWSNLRSSVLSQITNILDGGSTAVVEETPNYDLTDNKIDVTMIVMGSTTSGVVEYRQTTEDNIQYGVVLIPVWTGDPWSKYRYDGPATYQRTVTKTFRTFDKSPGLFGEPPPRVAGLGLALISDKVTETPIRMGTGSDTFDLKEITEVTVWEFFKTPSRGPGGTRVGVGGLNELVNDTAKAMADGRGTRQSGWRVQVGVGASIPGFLVGNFPNAPSAPPGAGSGNRIFKK